MITVVALQMIAPGCDDPWIWVEPMNAAAERFEINAPLRLAHWLAQLAHESVEYTRLEEGLSYSAERLMKVWPGRFKTYAQAKLYERQPEHLANFVYGGRLGNGPPESGDGFKYRGRGLIQLTGKDNYTEVGLAIGVDLLNHPQKAKEPDTAALVAVRFWQSRGLNELADADNAEAITRKINGGLIGWADRQKYLKRAKEALRV